MNGQKTTIVVRLILEKENKILFLKKTSRNGGGFSLIGGKVESQETSSTAIIRESHEEANIKIKKKHLRLIHVFKRESEKELILVYSAKKWGGEIESKELNKFTKTTWISKTKLPLDISRVTRRLLDEYFAKRFFSEEMLS